MSLYWVISFRGVHCSRIKPRFFHRAPRLFVIWLLSLSSAFPPRSSSRLSKYIQLYLWSYFLPIGIHAFVHVIPFPELSILPLDSVQFSCSAVSNSATPWTATCQASLSITNSQSLLKLMSVESVMPSSHLILCRPLLLLPPIPPSIRVFSNESTSQLGKN